MPALSPAPAKPKSDVAMLGRVKSIGDPKTTQSGKYEGIKVEIEGYPGQGVNITQSFYFKPEWFHPDFSPAIAFADDNGGMFMYSKFAGTGEGELGFIQGLCGTAQRFGELQTLCASLEVDANGVPTIASIAEVIVPFLAETPVIGYTRTQKQEKVFNADLGKNTYFPVKGFEIGTKQYGGTGWFYTDQKSLDRVRKEAKRREGKDNIVALEIMFDAA